MIIPIEQTDVPIEAHTVNPITAQVQDADAAPTYAVYEAGVAEAVASGTLTKRDGTTGQYAGTFDVTTAAGFAAGKLYTVVVTATVDAVTNSRVEKQFLVAIATSTAPCYVSASVTLNDTLPFKFVSHNSSGQAVNADSTPTYKIRRGTTEAPILTGNFSAISGETGAYQASIEITTANGFSPGTWYDILATVTVDGNTGKEFISIFRVCSPVVETGARIITITVDDGSDPLEDAHVRLTKGSETYIKETDASGEVVFCIDDGTWSVAITLSGYTFTPTTLVVDGDETQTYSMSSVSVPASNPGFVTGYGYCYDEEGVVESGVPVYLKFHDSTGSGVIHDIAPRTEISAASGLVTFTNLMTGRDYTARRGTSKRWKRITIPSDATSPFALPDFWGEE